MPAIKWALAALCLVGVSASPAQAASYVLGDSLGLGVATVARIKNLSRLSVHIRGSKAVEQFAQVPAGSTVFLVLGTNDAHGSITRLDKSIDNIVNVAARKRITLVWMGPPCVRTSWDIAIARPRCDPAQQARRHLGPLREHARRADVLGRFP